MSPVCLQLALAHGRPHCKQILPILPCGAHRAPTPSNISVSVYRSVEVPRSEDVTPPPPPSTSNQLDSRRFDTSQTTRCGFCHRPLVPAAVHLYCVDL
ncbi:hypothetical protein INR49_026043 [Caranx melampygus]|nr:hypothetical protein INR49_026043 [Caranx melampygus]